MRPSLTGLGHGRAFVETAIQYARETLHADTLRATIAAGNHRAIRVWSGLGFRETQQFQAPRTIVGSDTIVVLGNGR